MTAPAGANYPDPRDRGLGLAAVQARAARQTPAHSPASLVHWFASLTRVMGRGSTVNCDDVTRRSLGLPYLAPCSAGGSSAPIYVDPMTGGGVRVGHDLPIDDRPATLGRSDSWCARAGISAGATLRSSDDGEQ